MPAPDSNLRAALDEAEAGVTAIYESADKMFKSAGVVLTALREARHAARNNSEARS